MKFPRSLSHPWRFALINAIAVAIIAPACGSAGMFVWIVGGSQARISQCLDKNSRAYCEQANAWDPVSFANLLNATWGGFLLAAPVLSLISGAIAYRASKGSITKSEALPPDVVKRLISAQNRGFKLDEILKSFE